jgi:hypothetical protein
MAADWSVQAEVGVRNLVLVGEAEVAMTVVEMCFGVVQRSASVMCSPCWRCKKKSSTLVSTRPVVPTPRLMESCPRMIG